MYDYKIDRLKNGIKIITIENNKTDLLILLINFKLGNDIETVDKLLEISHFMEHLFCLFTSSKYPNGKNNREFLSNNNIDLDAEVVNKNIMFSLEFRKKHLDIIFDMVSNALLDFRIDNDMFDKEKNAVIEELNEMVKDSSYDFEMKINSILYRGHQREKTIKQRLENCKRVQPKDLLDYYNKYFTPRNFVVGLFGKIDSSGVRIIKQNLGKLVGKEYIYRKYIPYKMEKLIHYKKNDNISNIKLFFRIPYTSFDKEKYAINAIIEILSDDMNSLLFRKLRTEKGLVYDVNLELELDEIDSSLSMIEFSTLCNTKNLVKVIEIIYDPVKE